MRNDSLFAGLRCFRALRAAALALTTAFGLAAPAAAEPVFNDDASSFSVPPNTVYGVLVNWVFSDAGTNPRFTEAEFSTTAYYNQTDILAAGGALMVEVKTAAELRALVSPPPSPFTVTADVTMTNDEGETAEGTLTFKTTWDDGSTQTLPPPGGPPQPIFVMTEPILMLLGHEFRLSPFEMFDNAGDYPRLTEAEFSTKEYFNQAGIDSLGALLLEPKTGAELNALPTPPPSPFTVTVDVTMTNEMEQTGSGTITLEATYDRVEEPDEPETALPTFTQTGPLTAEPGGTVTFAVGDFFSNTGTNPRFEGWGSPDTQYLDGATGLPGMGEADDRLTVAVITESELNALASPPPATFTFTIDVTMTNDEGQYASGTLTFQTTYMRVDDGTPAPTSGDGG